MKLNTLLAGAVLALAAVAGSTGAQAAASLGVDFAQGSSTDFGGSVWNLGWSFTANSSVDVVGLGNWAGGGEFPQDQQVGLWDSQGDLLASAFVSEPGATVGTAPWVFASIDPVHLTAGDSYVVGAQGGADYTGIVPSSTFDPRITYLTDLYTYTGTGNSPLAEPTTSENAPYSWFGANVELGSAAPEPAAWLIMMAGIGGLGAVLRARRGPGGTLAA